MVAPPLIPKVQLPFELLLLLLLVMFIDFEELANADAAVRTASATTGTAIFHVFIVSSYECSHRAGGSHPSRAAGPWNERGSWNNPIIYIGRPPRWRRLPRLGLNFDGEVDWNVRRPHRRDLVVAGAGLALDSHRPARGRNSLAASPPPSVPPPCAPIALPSRGRSRWHPSNARR